MIPFNLDLPPIIKGVTYPQVIFYFKKDDGTAFPLTGWTVNAHARRDKTERYKLDLAPVITDAPNGEVKIQFTDEQTAQMTATYYGWDLVLTDPDGQNSGPYFAGNLPIQELYTHDV